MSMNTKEHMYALLTSLGAPDRLINHVKLVGEAAEDICRELRGLGINFNEKLVELGVAVHDAGKITHPRELDNPGNQHEPAGEKLMLENGIPPDIARCCVSHARYDQMEVSFEELLVALSDTLWKGQRIEDLEIRVIDEVADRLSKERWDIFTIVDSIFEQIAADGSKRLERSQ